MLADFESRLRTFAEVIVRVGLNLQRGQRLLITEPYELQGVARSAEVIVNAVKSVAGCPTEIIWGDGARLREFIVRQDWHGFAQLTTDNARKMERYVQNGDALLFLIGSQPKLFDGLSAEDVAELRRISSEQFGPIAHQLARSATNWTAVPAPNPAWAQFAYAYLPSEQRLEALWQDVFAALRVDSIDPIVAWAAHLDSLAALRTDLNQRRHTKMRYVGEGTNLSVDLPPEHEWRTAQLRTKFGHCFVANLPTEEVFTLPHKDSAHGQIRVAHPVHYAGSVIEGIELEFKAGRVVAAHARTGAKLLDQLLATDEGALRLGEVAFVPAQRTVPARALYHTLMDENLSSHIALGEAYSFCLRSPNDAALNRSLIHLDLPLDARVTWEPS
ncbi:aminopeptidase [Oleiharenicola lentus]|uniref:aminopeptidase n=1 Tax=Oleiharenicola lentus TaxID=2508720 RepID=UPI003F67A463